MALNSNNHRWLGMTFLNVQQNKLYWKPWGDNKVKFLCCNESCRPSSFFMFHERFNSCVHSLLSLAHGSKNTVWVVCWEPGHSGWIFWHGNHLEVVPSLLSFSGSTNQVVASVFGYYGNTKNGLPAPPSGALYLMTWRILTRTPTRYHLLADSWPLVSETDYLV